MENMGFPFVASVCCSVSATTGETGGSWCADSPGMGLRWKKEVFLSCLLPRATPASILACSGCEAVMEHLSETLDTARSLGCKSLDVTRTAGALRHSSTRGFRSPFCWSPGQLLWMGQLSLSYKSPARLSPLLPAALGCPTTGARSGAGWWDGSGSTERLWEGTWAPQPVGVTGGVQ